MIGVEVANNGYRDGFSNMNNTEQSFIKYGGVSVDQRKMNAVRAYFEWVRIGDNLFHLDLMIANTLRCLFGRSIAPMGKSLRVKSTNVVMQSSRNG
jgi:hypothetical protein